KTPKPETRNPKPETRNPKPETQNTEPRTGNRKPETENPKPEARNPKPDTLHTCFTHIALHCEASSVKRIQPLQPGSSHVLSGTKQRATKGFSAQIGTSFCYLIRRNPPMLLRVAFRRVLGLVA
ncbi:hypothetical protein T484DRAFT_1634687, partial [Baffinella frigidus]